MALVWGFRLRGVDPDAIRERSEEFDFVNPHRQRQRRRAVSTSPAAPSPTHRAPEKQTAFGYVSDQYVACATPNRRVATDMSRRHRREASILRAGVGAS